MLKKPIITFLLSVNIFTTFACFHSYPSYEEVLENRSKIKAIPFSKEKWFDDKGIGVEELWEVSPGLARDLVNRNLLIDKSYMEVQQLLGEQSKDVNSNSVTYALFYDMGVADPIYVEQLHIKFDDNDKVVSSEIKIRMMDGHPDYR